MSAPAIRPHPWAQSLWITAASTTAVLTAHLLGGATRPHLLSVAAVASVTFLLAGTTRQSRFAGAGTVASVMAGHAGAHYFFQATPVGFSPVIGHHHGVMTDVLPVALQPDLDVLTANPLVPSALMTVAHMVGALATGLALICAERFTQVIMHWAHASVRHLQLLLDAALSTAPCRHWLPSLGAPLRLSDQFSFLRPGGRAPPLPA